ncbi:hypothetical protein R1sor_012241 [Riccia sorocarpa]|uniref:Uncharacterized protein n=1 Tax=Riccia sorocarpa TaxID=122646 RepID=A0ABD3I707_9MARC
MEINMEQVPAPTPAEETPTSPAYIIIEREDLQDVGDDDIELLLKSGYAIGAGPKPYECSKANLFKCDHGANVCLSAESKETANWTRMLKLWYRLKTANRW